MRKLHLNQNLIYRNFYRKQQLFVIELFLNGGKTKSNIKSMLYSEPKIKIYITKSN